MISRLAQQPSQVVLLPTVSSLVKFEVQFNEKNVKKEEVQTKSRVWGYLFGVLSAFTCALSTILLKYSIILNGSDHSVIR